MLGSFELLHHQSGLQEAKAVQLKDIKEFARDLVECMGSEEANRDSYLQLLPRGKRRELEDHVYDLEDLDRRIKAKDITIYQDYHLWYKSVQERIRAKACQ